MREKQPRPCVGPRTQTQKEGDNRTRCRIRLGEAELATVLSFHQNILCVRPLKLNKEGDDSRFIYELDLSDLRVLYACFSAVLYVLWSVGGTADLRTCGERRQGREVRGVEEEATGSRPRPFPMEQAIGGAQGTCNGTGRKADWRLGRTRFETYDQNGCC